MQLIFIYGPPAVGKLTIARELSALTGLALFHNHLVVDLLTSTFEFGSESFVQLREEIWFGVFRQAARQGKSLIFTFAPERTVRPSFGPAVVTTVEKAGGTVHFVRLTCAGDELERRVVDGSRATFGKLRSLEQFRALSRGGAFDYPPLPADLTIDTTALTPGDATQRIRDSITRCASRDSNAGPSAPEADALSS